MLHSFSYMILSGTAFFISTSSLPNSPFHSALSCPSRGGPCFFESGLSRGASLRSPKRFKLQRTVESDEAFKTFQNINPAWIGLTEECLNNRKTQETINECVICFEPLSIKIVGTNYTECGHLLCKPCAKIRK